MWSEYGKLGNPLVSSFLDAGTRDGTIGIPHINLANDYFGKEIFNRTVDKIIGGKPIHVLDLGAGTGGTTEAVVHWVYALASAEGIQDKVNLYVVGVEFNNRLAGEYEVRADALRRQFPGVKISVVEGEMSAYVAELVESSGGTFDAIVASYSLHHLKQQTRTDLFRHSSTLLSNGGVFLRADPSEAKSEINKRYFNFTDEGTFASFDSGVEAAQAMRSAGLEAFDMLGSEYIPALNQLMGEAVTNELVSGYLSHKGYITLGVKPNVRTSAHSLLSAKPVNTFLSVDTGTTE